MSTLCSAIAPIVGSQVGIHQSPTSSNM